MRLKEGAKIEVGPVEIGVNAQELHTLVRQCHIYGWKI